ncbi:hypothetical protein JCM10213v2_007760 [Rhodosporidiobolus nylandii]
MSAPPAPAFTSTTSLWPLGQDGVAKKDSSDAPKKPSRKQRARKKQNEATTTAPPPPPPAASSSAAPGTAKAAPAKQKQPQQQGQQQGQQQQRSRSDFPWRNSGRGRGRGGASARGGATTGGRAFSTATSAPVHGQSTSGGTSSAEDVGIRIPFFRPGQGQPAPGSWRALHTDSSSAQNSGVEGQMPPPVPGAGQPASGQGKKKKGKQENAAERILKEVALKEGEEGGLEKEIMRLYETQRPTPESIDAREHLIYELTSWLNSEPFRWGHQHSRYTSPLRIEQFGSMRFGLGTSSSDLDLCLLDPYRPNGFVEKFFSSADQYLKELPDIYNMRKIGRSLQRANLSDVQAIPDAAVPICKFKVMIDGHLIEADLNTNERLGVFNSRLINSYCNLHPVVRPLSVFIKFWAKQRGLNNPSGTPTTFSSYTLILMIIAYLQTLNLLPNLQSASLIEQTGTERTRFFSTPKGRSKRYKRIVRSVGWDVTFVEYDEGPPEGYEPREVDIVELARGFFRYYGGPDPSHSPSSSSAPSTAPASPDPSAASPSPALAAPAAPEQEQRYFDPQTQIVSICSGSPLSRVRRYREMAEIRRQQDRERTADLKRRMGLLAVSSGGEGEGIVSQEEETRQDDEDAVVAAFGAAPEPETVEAAKQETVRLPGRPDSRASDPLEYEEYEEPERWSDHLMVVQDPFILTRNCAGNVSEEWVEELRVQMRRAASLISARAPLSEICASVKGDPNYRSVAQLRWEAARAATGGLSKGEKRRRKMAAEAAAAQAKAQEVKAEGAKAEGAQDEEPKTEEPKDDAVVLPAPPSAAAPAVETAPQEPQPVDGPAKDAKSAAEETQAASKPVVTEEVARDEPAPASAAEPAPAPKEEKEA